MMVVAIKLYKTHTLMASGMMRNRTEFQDNPFSLVSFREKIHLLLHREEENSVSLTETGWPDFTEVLVLTQTTKHKHEHVTTSKHTCTYIRAGV